MPGYHSYVFDTAKREFVGKFEEMYQAEDTGLFDSWYEMDLRPLRKQISQVILSAYSFSSILDVGCGKGVFTHLMKKGNNRVVGLDVSPTAIRKAKQSFPDIDFRCMNVNELSTLGQSFDLVVVMGTFAYVDGWPRVLETIAGLTRWVFVAEFIPPNPIGFVKSPNQLITEVAKHFAIRTQVLLDEAHCMLLGEVVESPNVAENSNKAMNNG